MHLQLTLFQFYLLFKNVCHVFRLHICVAHARMSAALRGQEWDPQELERWMVVSHHEGAEN